MYVCIREIIREIIMKMSIKMKNRSHRYNINSLRSRTYKYIYIVTFTHLNVKNLQSPGNLN